MGILRDNGYWGDVVNRMEQLRPPLGDAMSKESAAQIRSIACEALNKLVNDPEFREDIEHVVALGMSATVVDNPDTPDFPRFLNAFMLLENKILADSNVNTAAARDLQNEIHRVAMNREQPKDRFDRLAEKIAFCAKLACDRTILEDPKKPPLLAVVWRAAKGVALIGMNMGTAGAAAVTLGPVGAAATGTVAGISASYGASLIHEAIKGRW